MRRCRAALSVLLVLLPWAMPAPARAQAKAAPAWPKTRPERTNFAETSRYDDVVRFLEALATASPRIHLTTFGYTFEGRPLPLAVVGAPDARPDSVIATGKTRVYIQGNIHAGEVEGKEAMQEILRSLAIGEHAAWTNSLVLLIAPIYNADGNERVRLTNRGRQNGPIGGMGQRPNAQDYDLNRDHMKLESPEARSLAFLFQRYDPHLAVDLHTTDGSFHGYHLTYAPPLHPNTDAAIIDLLRKDWLPTLTRAIKAKYGWDYYYYGNVGGGQGGERAWSTFDHRPRFNNNYVGLRNRFALLGETYSYATFEERIGASRRFVEEILNYAQGHAAEIRRITAEVDKQSLVGQTLAVRAKPQRSAEPVEVLMGEVSEERNPYTGQMMYRRKDVRKPERMYEYGTFAPDGTERVPRFYFVPAELRRVVDRLEGHGIKYSKLEQPLTIQAEQFRIDSSETAAQPFQGHQERTVTGAYETTEKTVPAGALVVPLEQPLGRLAFYLLEPRSDDGVLDWNLLDDVLKDAKYYPIVRTFNAVR